MIEISIDPKQLIGVCAGMESQLPFATAKALNEVAVAFQMAERAQIQSGFIIRRPWVLQGVKINRGDFATKNKLEVTIGIDPSRDFLSKFEMGGTKVPRGGHRSLTVPIGAKRTAQSIVPAALRVKALHFTGSGRVLKGDKDTILIRRPDGSGVILQRKARQASLKKRQHGPVMRGQQRDYALTVLYVLKPRTPLPAHLHFHQTARETFLRQWPSSFSKWWNESVRTANTGKPIAQGMALPAGWTE